MGFFSDIVIGAISKGVNKPTFVFINVALVGCVLLLVSLVFGGDTPPDVLPHLVVLIFFAVGLLGSVNWLISQVGTVSAEEQQKELFSDEQAHEEKKTE